MDRVDTGNVNEDLSANNVHADLAHLQQKFRVSFAGPSGGGFAGPWKFGLLYLQRHHVKALFEHCPQLVNPGGFTEAAAHAAAKGVETYLADNANTAPEKGFLKPLVEFGTFTRIEFAKICPSTAINTLWNSYHSLWEAAERDAGYELGKRELKSKFNERLKDEIALTGRSDVPETAKAELFKRWRLHLPEANSQKTKSLDDTEESKDDKKSTGSCFRMGFVCVVCCIILLGVAVCGGIVVFAVVVLSSKKSDDYSSSSDGSSSDSHE